MDIMVQLNLDVELRHLAHSAMYTYILFLFHMDTPINEDFPTPHKKTPFMYFFLSVGSLVCLKL